MTSKDVWGKLALRGFLDRVLAVGWERDRLQWESCASVLQNLHKHRGTQETASSKNRFPLEACREEEALANMDHVK